MNLLSFSFSLTDKTLTYLISSIEDVLKQELFAPHANPQVGVRVARWSILDCTIRFSLTFIFDLYASIALFNNSVKWACKHNEGTGTFI